MMDTNFTFRPLCPSMCRLQFSYHLIPGPLDLFISACVTVFLEAWRTVSLYCVFWDCTAVCLNIGLIFITYPLYLVSSFHPAIHVLKFQEIVLHDSAFSVLSWCTVIQNPDLRDICFFYFFFFTLVLYFFCSILQNSVSTTMPLIIKNSRNDFC